MVRRTTQPVRFSWTPEAVTDYWDYLSSRADLSRHYFSKQVGAGVVGFVGAALRLEGAMVLDCGCGPGHLAGHLMSSGAIVHGVDSSADSVSAANERFRGCAGWGGAVVNRGGELPYGESTFDLVFSVETVEHVLDHELRRFLSEIRRVLRPSGVAVFTTPNDEDLTAGMSFCPACGAEFHQWQHVRSWNRSTLSSALAHAGFEVEFCADLDFRDFLPPVAASWTRLTPRLAALRVLRRLDGVLDRLERRRFPHLRSIARRVGSGAAPHLVAIARKPPVTLGARQ